MRIFIDTSARWNSGFETHIINFIKNLDKFINSDEIILYGHSNLINKISVLSSKVDFVIDNSIPQSTIKSLIWRRYSLPKILSKFKPDLHFNLMGWINHNNSIIKAGMNRNLQPFIPAAIKINPFLTKEYFRLILHRKEIIKSYRRCDGLIFNSDYARESILPFIGGAIKTTVIPHGVNSIFFNKPQKHNLNDPVKLLYISDFYPYKNHINLISAARKVSSQLKININLTLIGSIPNYMKSKISNIIKQTKSSYFSVNLMGRMPNNSLQEQFLINDIFVFPSSVESFGHSLIEAMAAGMPIACSNKRPMSDLANGSAILFDENSIDEVANAIKELVSNDVLRNKLSNTAFEKAHQFSYENMTKDTLNFLRSLN